MSKLDERLRKEADSKKSEEYKDMFLCIHYGEYSICKQCDTYGRLNNDANCKYYEAKAKK